MAVHTSPVATGMSVSALAGRVGVRPDTVRYYERIGLLPPPARTLAEHRRYDETAVDRLQFVQGAQRLGLRLREINDLLARVSDDHGFDRGFPLWLLGFGR